MIFLLKKMVLNEVTRSRKEENKRKKETFTLMILVVSSVNVRVTSES